MRAAVAVVLSLSLSLAACFPDNPGARRIAKIGAGAAIVGGIALLYFTNTNADCDMMAKPGTPNDDCKRNSDVANIVGFGLIMAGLVGFIATVSTEPDDDKPRPAPPTPTVAPTPAPPPAAPASPTPIATD